MKPSTAIKTIALGIALTATQACSKGGSDDPQPNPGNKNPLEANVNGTAKELEFAPSSLTGNPNEGGGTFVDEKTGKTYILAYFKKDGADANATVSYDDTQILDLAKSKYKDPNAQEYVAYNGLNPRVLKIKFNQNAKSTETLGAQDLTLTVKDASAAAFLYAGSQSKADQYKNNIQMAADAYASVIAKTNDTDPNQAGNQNMNVFARLTLVK